MDNIAQVKIICNVVQEATVNIAQEKILCNVVLILLGQYSTGKTLCNIFRDDPNTGRDTAKNPVQRRLVTVLRFLFWTG